MSADARDALRMSHMRLQQRCHDAEAHVERLLAEIAEQRSFLLDEVHRAEDQRDAYERRCDWLHDGLKKIAQESEGWEGEMAHEVLGDSAR